MDRRIQKSRQAIYRAFITLLNQKSYEKITVQELIDEANVGRSTFYAHFETKEALLEEVCQDLFEHTFVGYQKEMTLYELLAHLFLHFKRNQDKIATLLLSNNSYFIRRLKDQLEIYLFPHGGGPYLESKGPSAQGLFKKTCDRQLCGNRDLVAARWQRAG